jgi:hypothetical protein
MKRLLEQRWSGHYATTKAVINNYTAVKDALATVCDPDNGFPGDDVAQATGILCIVKQHAFRFAASVMNVLLGMLSPIDKRLQARETDLQESMTMVSTVIQEIESMRCVDSYHKLLDKAELMTAEDTDQPTREKRARIPSILLNENTGAREHSAMKEVFFQVIDTIVEEMRRRFTSNGALYQAIATMSITNEDFLSRDNLSALSTFGVELPSLEELKIAKAFLLRLHEQEEIVNPSFVLKQLHRHRDAFPATYSVAAVVATFGCSTAICESSFSTLARIDRPQRRSMLTARLARLTYLAFESQKTKAIDMEEFIQIFAGKSRRIQLT